MAAIRQARSAERERQRPPVRHGRGRALRGRHHVEAQGFDPKPRGIDDVENHGVRLGHLACDRRALGDDAGHGSHQRFRGSADRVERAAPVFQALQLKTGLFELREGDGAARRQTLVTREPALDDVDLLVQFALALAHVGYVDRLHRRRHLSEHVALPHRGAETRKSIRRR